MSVRPLPRTSGRGTAVPPGKCNMSIAIQLSATVNINLALYDTERAKTYCVAPPCGSCALQEKLLSYIRGRLDTLVRDKKGAGPGWERPSTYPHLFLSARPRPKDRRTRCLSRTAIRF